jgi:radical SAM superfamily enzyme YgiQ (UPF0313 family)
MKVLFIQPRYPDTFWSLRHALRFISKKAVYPPLGLMTVSAMTPDNWTKKLVDLNASFLKDEQIMWADMIFISAMTVQSESVFEVIARCRSFNKKMVGGGPLFSVEPEKFNDVDYLVLNEAEITFPMFLSDLEKGTAKHMYQTDEFADLSMTPVPDYSLINKSHYASQSVQFSRGCPFNCEFCDITALLGHKVRTKTPRQILAELDEILKIGWKGGVFFVDDNFIGNKKILKQELLPSVISWMEKNKYPFTFITEASINLADDDELMQMMVRAGFIKVFVGIETPDELSLAECNKTQNHNRDLLSCVKTIQAAGMEVTAGFIVGFDNDKPSIFQRQIDFIQKSGIVTAMVGLLNAPRKTQLYKRLEKEGRIVSDFYGDPTGYAINFIPKMDLQELMTGYQKIITGIYSSEMYNKRVLSFLKSYNPPLVGRRHFSFDKLMAFFKSVIIIGILEKNRKYYWMLFFWSLFRKPKVFPLAVTYSIQGYHYRKVFKNID